MFNKWYYTTKITYTVEFLNIFKYFQQNHNHLALTSYTNGNIEDIITPKEKWQVLSMWQLKSNTKKDIACILSISSIFATLYIICGDAIMDYGNNSANPLLLRFLPVLFIQFGMSCLGIIIVLIRNKERLSSHGLVNRNAFLSIIGCLLVSIPTVISLWISNDIHGFLPFQGMFLTDDILKSVFPFNILGYLVIALVWGLGEGLFYVVLADKINALKKPSKLWNWGAFFCSIIAIAIHGMIDCDITYLFSAISSFTQECGPSFFQDNPSIMNLALFLCAVTVILLHGILELIVKNLCMALPTFILIYGSLFIREKTGNSWGNILIFFVIWNAL